MAIDRGPWNALVDDDGSNLVGTVWNKDKIKTVILDPTDAAIVAPWVDVPFNAANFVAAPSGTWTVTAQTLYRYAILSGTTVLLNIVIPNSTISGATPVRLKITLPAPIQANTGANCPLQYSLIGAGVTNGGIALLSGSYLDCLRDPNGTPFPVSTGVYLYLTGVYNIL